MRKAPRLWCMEYAGKLVPETLDEDRERCRWRMFSLMDEDFRERHWKNPESTFRAYAALRIRPVLVEIRKVKGGER